MPEAPVPNIKYYFKEDTNQILVSGSDNKVGMNVLLNSTKLPTPPVGGVFLSKISSLGMNSSYVVQNGNDTTEIPIADNQELWVYRGHNGGSDGDGPTYRYNPHLHRPYKAYILTETGSGTPAHPFSPTGSLINTNAGNGTLGQDIPSFYLEGQLEILGNSNILISSSAVSGSFTVYDDTRNIYPWVFTKYHTLSSPPGYGAQVAVYKEDATLTFVTGSSSNTVKFNIATAPVGGVSAIGKDKLAFNNSTISSISEVYFDYQSTYANSSLSVWNNELLQLSQSFVQGKTGGQIRIYSGSDPSQYVTFDIDSIEDPSSSPPNFWTVGVSNPTSTNLGALFADNTPLTASFIGIADLQSNYLQQQSTTTPITPQVFTNQPFSAGTYSYTSSVFSQAGLNGSVASGSTQFGLCTGLDFYAQYRAVNQPTNGGTVRVFFTGSGGTFDSSYIDLEEGYQANYRALVGTVSASGITAPTVLTQSDGTITSNTFTNEIINESVPGTTPSDLFATRLNDVYISYSASLSSSLDGLYIFNQLPQNDVQVTASMFLTAWTGSDPDGAKYGNADYGTDNYGEGEAGDGKTWPTASLRIYTGSYPNRPFGLTGDFVTESMFMDENIHVNGLAVTMSYLIPSQSIAIKDCLQIALAVTSSQPLTEITSSLVVSEYYLEFNTPTQSIEGDGRVPTFIENAFDNTLGLSNTDDCQPLYANVVGERTNKFIQNVDYTTGAYMPTNFQLILSGSASRATVPESYYTQLAQINPRYLGSETQALEINSIEGLMGGYGNLPVIDYLTGYFAYADQVLDPYPVVNNKVQLNLKYLINAAGDALQPILSPYTAFDVEGSWTAGGLGRLGVNQISGSSQYDSLNGLNSIYEVAKEPVAILWSQTSSAGYSNYIPLAGNPNEISNFVADFLQYGFSVDGTAKNGETNDKNITLNNLLAGVSSSGNYTFTTSSNFGYYNATYPEYASSSIISDQFDIYGDGSGQGDDGARSTAEGATTQGLVRFNRDIVQGGGGIPVNTTSLSDSWKIRLFAEFPSTPPHEYRTDAGGWNDSSDYNRSFIGHLAIKLQYSTNGTSGWTDMRMTELEDPVLRLFYGTSQININLKNVLGSGNAGLRNSSKQYYINIHANNLRNAVSQQGRNIKDATYASFLIDIRSNEILQAGRYYRFQVEQYYLPESVDAARNYWNPQTRPQYVGSANTPYRAFNGPYVSAAIQGSRDASNIVANALNEPFWVFTGSLGGGATISQEVIQLSSSNGNEAYGNGYFQGYLAYSASENPRFPGGIEPIDTEIPSYNVEWRLQVGDEIRFENNESQTYTITEITSSAEATDGHLTLKLDRVIPANIEKDFFLIRRYRYSPNTIVLNNLFPYAALKTVQTQVDNTLTDSVTKFFGTTAGGTNDANATEGYYTQSMASTSSGSISYVSTIQPLTKKDNTPSGYFFPEYPTADIELNTDEVIKDLRDKKLIE